MSNYEYLHNGFFDKEYYLFAYPEVGAEGLDPLDHYLKYGWREGRDPSRTFHTNYYLYKYGDQIDADVCPLIHYAEAGKKDNLLTRDNTGLFETRIAVEPYFDAEFYQSQNPEVADAGLDPLDHYLLHGWREGRDPSGSFDAAYYVHSYGRFFGDIECPLLHYAKIGEKEGLQTKDATGLFAQRDVVKDLFDADFYLDTYPEVAQSDVDPLDHYLKYGWREGRDPSRTFHTNYYLYKYGDQIDADVCPLIHYAEAGKKDNLLTRDNTGLFETRIAVEPYFDAEFYQSQNPEVADAGLDPLDHYLLHGWREGRDPSGSFDAAYYVHSYGRFFGDIECPLLHYAKIGEKEGLQTKDATGLFAQRDVVKDLFDADFYLDTYPEVAQSDVDPLDHYLKYGWQKGRDPSRTFHTNYYLYKYGDQIDADVCPLIHYAEAGKKDNLLTRDNTGLFETRIAVEPYFDAEFYQSQNPEVADAGLDPLDHYLLHGWREGRDPSGSFDAAYYVHSYGRFFGDIECPLLHYAKIGEKEGLQTKDATGLFAQRDVVKDLFDADFYLDTYPEVAQSDVDPLDHYLKYGWREGRDPSPTFSTSYYIGKYADRLGNDTCPLVHYCKIGKKENLLTQNQVAVNRKEQIQQLCQLVEPLFDKEYYLSKYKEVVDAGIDPLYHYLTHGWQEGRDPSATFDTKFYASTYGDRFDDQTCPLVHYAQFGRHEGLLTRDVDYIAQFVSSGAGHVDNLLRSISEEYAFLGLKTLQNIVVPMFSADWYRKQYKLDSAVSDLECLFRYLVRDFGRGLPPGPLFDGKFYSEQAARHGLDAPEDPENSYLHWLRHGVDQDVCPVRWFNRDTYLEFNNEVEEYDGSLFMHFVRHGIKENRKFLPQFYVCDIAHPRVRSPRLLKLANLLTQEQAAVAETSGMLDFWRSGSMHEIVARAAGLEPEISMIDEGEVSIIPPWHDDEYRAFEEIAPLMSGQYDNVILTPFCKMGGADYVSGVLANILTKQGRTILLRTDQPDWARPDWFPDEMDTIDLSVWLQPLRSRTRNRLLYELVRMLKPKNIFNVNSRTGFEVFERYGARLQTMTNLFAYYFCAEQLPSGRQVGYPVSYFANVLPFLKAAMVDSEYLGQGLSKRYCLPEEIREKVIVAHTPAASDSLQETLASRQAKSKPTRKTPVILWAGRFDRQKRFDLLVEIARNMPDVTFKCWGKAVLDPMPSLSNLPTNLTVHAPFQSYDELPLLESDGLLYTSAWDGMPTILIEFGAMGMPIVASAVGGVPELIDDTTGWPVDPDGSVEDYIKAILEMLSNPSDRLARASALQARVQERHNQVTYEKLVNQLVN